MKKQVYFLKMMRRFMILLFAIMGSCLLAQNVPEYMYFKFDAAGNQQNYASAPVGNNPATLTGLTIGGTGQFGTAMIGDNVYLDGLNTGWATSMPAGGWTISMWLNNLPNNTNLNYLFGDVNATSFRCFLGGAAGAGNILLRTTGLTGWTDVNVAGVTPGPTVVTFVFTGTSIKYYINGALTGTVAESIGAITGSGPFYVGTYNASGYGGLPAGSLMDEFRMYNRALSDAEVGSTWNQQLPLSGPPVCVTAAATAITGTTATLNGTVNANGSSTTVSFDYGLTTSYGTNVPGVPLTVTGTTATAVSAAITGLTPNTLYHFRVNGVNSNGTTNGSDMTFTTAPPPPTVVTTAASGIGLTTATVNGTVNANNSSATVTFQYGLTVAYGSTVAGVPSPVTGTTVTNVSAALSGLTGNTTYHYRVVATSAGGTSNGNDMTFNTAGPPIVVTNLPSNVTTNSAQLNGTVTANNLSTTVSFNWGLTVAYGNSVAAVPATVTGNTATPVQANIGGLTNNITYHYQCVGVNAGGTTLGSDQTFLTGCTPPGTPGTIAGPTNVCQGTCNYVYSISPIPNTISYNWTVPVGATIMAGAGTTSITVCYSSNALYGFVSVAGVGSCGVGPSGFLGINVYSSPSPTISGPSTTCIGTTSTYQTQFGYSSYTWSVTGGTIVSGLGTYLITVNWITSGAGSVSVNYTNMNGCSAPSPTVYNVTVNALPTPTITGANNMCVNSGSYSYTTQTGFSSYVWTVSSGGTIITGQGTSTILVSWIAPGAQSVAVNYSNSSGCSALSPTVFAVTVASLPGPAGTITGTTPVCAGAQGVAYSVGTVTGATAYVWTLPTGATIASGAFTNNITVNYSSTASNGNITVSGNNICGNGSVSPPFAVTVNPLPAAAGTITGPASVCTGAQGVVYTVPPVNGATGYTWSLPDAVNITNGANTNSITVTFLPNALSGNIAVHGTNSCGNGQASPNLAVTIYPIPAAPVVTNTGTTLHSNYANGNQWYFQGTLITGATGQTYVATQDGYYWDVVTLNGCSSDSSNHVMILTTGINPHSNAVISVYPVPNEGQFNVSITTASAETFSISAYNNLGVKIYEEARVDVNGTLQKVIDLRPVPAGIYTLIFGNSQNQVVKKIVVNK